MVSSKIKTRTLLSLTPTDFENLVFDIMIARGMSNVTWRTPGADGGRDIEGRVVSNDFSDSQTSAHWYVECKRYTGSVDWPTVYTKIAFADTNGADVLLMCTSSKFTPTAITNADNWNAKRQGLTIRLWPGHKLESLLQMHPDIAMKYGLKTTPNVLAGSTLQIGLALSKSVGSYYSKIVFSNEPVPPMLEASRNLALLLQRKMEDVAIDGRFNMVPFRGENLDIENCKVDAGEYKVDEAALGAFVSYLGAILNVELHVVRISEYSCKIVSVKLLNAVYERYKKIFFSIALWGNFEYDVEEFYILIRQRYGN